MNKLNELVIEKTRLTLELENINILIGQERGKMPRSQSEYNKVLRELKELRSDNGRIREENLTVRRQFQAYRESIIQAREARLDDE